MPASLGQTDPVPEGDTIRRLAERISDRFLGQRCTRSIARDPRITHLDLVGSTLAEVDAVGKWWLLRFDDGRTVYGHLRMDGRFDLGRRSSAPEWQRRLELEMQNGWMTAVDMPIIGVVPTAREQMIVGHLGPDLCTTEPPDIDAITARLRSNGDRPLAGALLDQRNVAGFGNVYAVEVPFIAGVSPHQPVDSIDDLDALVAAGSALIRTNMERSHRNTTGRKLHTTNLWVYGRQRRPCPWCSTTLRGASAREAPWERVSTWCPSCQAVEAQRTVDTARIERSLILHPARHRFPAERPDQVDTARPN